MKTVNNKGFSLIEVLAVVVILGIVMSISIISIRSVINKSHDEYFKNLEKNIISAAEAFTDKNRSYLPKNVGKKERIELQWLIDNNFIKEPKSYNKKVCKIANSYVNVFKYNKTNYNYTVYLDCEGKEKINEQIFNNTPEVKIEFENYKEVTADGKIEKQVAKDTVAIIKYIGNDKLYSYSYIVTLTLENGGKVIAVDSGNVQANGKEDKKIILKLYEYAYNKGYNSDDIKEVEVKAYAINYHGNTGSGYGTLTGATDGNKPKCPRLDNETDIIPNKKENQWTNKDLKIKIKCTDDESECEKDYYTKKFTKDTRQGKITIKDNAGNSEVCNVNVYLDKTTPTCDISGMPTEWVNTDVTIKATCKSVDKKGESYSGCTEESTKTFKVTSNDEYKIDYQMYNRAGGTGKCKAKLHLMIDKNPPTIEKCNEMNLKGKNPSCKAKDNESGVSKILYCLKENDKTVPNNNDSCFNKTTNDDLINNKGKDACGKTYYLYAIAVDKMGNKSDVKLVGTASSGEDKCTHSDWNKECLDKETVINCNNSCIFKKDTTVTKPACKPTYNGPQQYINTCCFRSKEYAPEFDGSIGGCSGSQRDGYYVYCVDKNGNIIKAEDIGGIPVKDKSDGYRTKTMKWWCSGNKGLGVVDASGNVIQNPSGQCDYDIADKYYLN